jgi:hypothetical protein
MRARSAVASALLAFAVAGCRDTPRATEADASATLPLATATPASASAATASAATAAPSASLAAAPGASGSATGAKPPACRVVGGEGGPGPTADASTWLALPAKATLSVRMLETGKDVRFEGPGDVRACGGEVALVAEGAAVALPSAGEAPGNEQWVANPCAVARWATGIHRFATETNGCTLQSFVGSAWLWLPEGAKLEATPLDGGAEAAPLPEAVDGWRRIDARRAVKIRSGAPSPLPAILACEKAAADVNAIAAKMRDGGGAKLGELMPASIASRRHARAACALAAARVERAKATSLEPRLARAAASL